MPDADADEDKEANKRAVSSFSREALVALACLCGETGQYLGCPTNMHKYAPSPPPPAYIKGILCHSPSVYFANVVQISQAWFAVEFTFSSFFPPNTHIPLPLIMCAGIDSCTLGSFACSFPLPLPGKHWPR